MSSLRQNFKAYYTKDEDILETFYKPCISNSHEYRRVTGYFSSLIFDLADAAFLSFFIKGGKMKVVCSPQLPKNDLYALSNLETFHRQDSVLLADLLKEDKSKNTAEIMCFLIASDFLQIRLATLDDSDDIMHEKFGVFSQGDDAVSFNGSINETGRGWGKDKNKESFNVFVSWDDRDNSRVNEHTSRFNAYWKDLIPGVSVRTPDRTFLQLAAKNASVGEQTFKQEIAKIQKKRSIAYAPLDYQQEVLTNWKAADRRGMVKFCTGAGKTVVGLLAIDWAASQGIPTLIIVPGKTLLYQWANEVISVFPSAKVLKVGDGHTAWRQRGLLEGYLQSSDEDPNVVIAILPTASSKEFVARASKNTRAFLLGDEVHNFGAPKYSQVLTLDYEFRLGLSATPERYGDPTGTEKLFEFFGCTLNPVIDIPTAIKKNRLVPYIYDFRVAQLNDEEQKNWDALSKKISQLIARGLSKSSDRSEVFAGDDLQKLVIKRARIAKKANSKINICLDLIRENYKSGERWLIFLEDSSHVGELAQGLKKLRLRYMRYEGSTPIEERHLIADHLAESGGIVLSMRCLDEGVDIPSVSHAVILSSSQNPRQFVQRRGRVLRYAGEGKRRAYIWDIITMPQIGANDQTKALILAEISRAIEFANYAENPSVKTRLEVMLAEYGLSVEDCVKVEAEIKENGDE